MPMPYDASEEEIKHKSEGLRLLYDTLKHLTTLSTASILILVTFIEKFFSSPEWKILIALAFLGFILSMIGSVALMFYLSFRVQSVWRKKGEFELNFISIAFLGSTGFFVMGIISLIIFALKNF